MAEALSNLERQIVGLIEEGYVRWKIAEQVGLGETKVREVIRALCERYDCSMRDLPETIRRKGES